MIYLNTHLNLLLRKKFKEEALELACNHGLNPSCIICFKESDLTDYNPGNLIGQINSLSEEGFIRWVYEKFEKNDSEEEYYKIKEIALTTEGEKLLKSYSIMANSKPIIIGTISGLLTAYLAIKFGFV